MAMALEASALGSVSDAGGTQVSYAYLGGRGQSALMIHGFGSDRMSWLANQSALESVVSLSALDLPGHGTSGMDVGDGGVATLAQRTADLLDRRRLSKLHIIGHSLGGGIALLLAATRPDLVRSLVLISPAGLGQAIDPAFLATFPALTELAETEALLQRLVVRPRLIGKPLVSLVLDQLQRPGARDALRLIARGLAASGAALDAAAARVTAVETPRLVIWGEEDSINPRFSERLVEFGGEFRLVSGAAHMPHIESPGIVNAEIVQFLAKVEAGIV
jgi:pimeloyl-ACP methyl ester carboxylesterase